ncbi:MAG TPA: hypothetical protein VFO71_10980 [Gemmatimonadales bacterium]|nr:hypothetical protein [Gemmatimonadales bacterium]
MYRIELSPGEETAFRSIEELAVAIRRKVVTSRARIYHNATGRWLPIQFHPHYKLAMEMPLTQADLVAGPRVAPLSALKLGDAATRATPNQPPSATREAATQAALAAWPEPKPVSPPPPKPIARPTPKAAEPPRPPIQLGTPAPEHRRGFEPPVAPAPRRPQQARIPEPRAQAPLAPAKSSHRRRKPLRSLRVALVGAVLIACAHLVVSAASTPTPETAARPRTPRRLIQAPAEKLKDGPPRTVAAVMPGLQTIPVTGLNTPRRPGPTLPPAGASLQPAPLDSVPAGVSAPELEPAPSAAEINLAAPAEAESLAPPVVDSTGKRTLKRLLRTISGSPAPEVKARR